MSFTMESDVFFNARHCGYLLEFTVAILIGRYGEHCPLGVIIVVFFVFLQDVPCRIQ